MNVVSLLTATLVLATAFSAYGQTPVASTPTPLSQLLAEAEANNPQISAADHGARAARQMAPQVTTLPDPKFTYQQFSVGSPKPFAGYTNSDFAYIGVGASQELPYPGKLRAARGRWPNATPTQNRPRLKSRRPALPMR